MEKLKQVTFAGSCNWSILIFKAMNKLLINFTRTLRVISDNLLSSWHGMEGSEFRYKNLIGVVYDTDGKTHTFNTY